MASVSVFLVFCATLYPWHFLQSGVCLPRSHMLTLYAASQTRSSPRPTRLASENAVDPVAPAARHEPKNSSVLEEEHTKQKRPPERVAKAAVAHPKPEPAIVPSKRRRGALADITVPNQAKEVTKVDTDLNPKHSTGPSRQRQSAPIISKNQTQPKSVGRKPPKHAKAITVYKTHSTTKKTASRQIRSRGQLFVKDAVTVEPPGPAGNNPILSVLCSETGVNGPTGPVQPSQEEVVQEEEWQEPKRKRRKLSVEGEPTGSDLRPCSEELIRAEDGEPDDLDKDDAIDPCMEPEYQAECYQYMRELEVSGDYF